MNKKRLISLVVAVVMVCTLCSGMVFADSVYKVKSGDVLWKIGKQLGVDYKKIAEYNELKDVNKIYAGQELKVPTVDEKKEEAPVVEAKAYTTKDLNEQNVMAILWMQKSSEYRALCYQAYNMGKLVIDNKLAADTSDKKKAIIIDADETVIDNTAYQAHLIGRDYGYSSSTWADWMNAEETKAMPGATEFLNYCKDKNVEVFYVTNRKMVGYQATLNNLKALGFPYVDEKHMMLRTDTSNKDARRAKVNAEYNVVLYMGDNLNDFSSDFAKKNIEDRFALTDQNKAKFGTEWIVLPNPTYGEWDGAVIGYNWGLDAAGKDKVRKDNLIKWVPAK